MGYDLHITRREFWADQDQDITADEWLKIVGKDTELVIDIQNGPYSVLWKPINNSGEYWLDWFDGNIYSKNPDEILIQKMLEISRQLNAKVQGDDGELYNEVIQKQERRTADKKNNSWLGRIFGKR
jgi:hypothetical protein